MKWKRTVLRALLSHFVPNSKNKKKFIHKKLYSSVVIIIFTIIIIDLLVTLILIKLILHTAYENSENEKFKLK